MRIELKQIDPGPTPNKARVELQRGGLTGWVGFAETVTAPGHPAPSPAAPVSPPVVPVPPAAVEVAPEAAAPSPPPPSSRRVSPTLTPPKAQRVEE